MKDQEAINLGKSIRKIWLSVRRENQISRRTTKNTDVIVRRTTINFHAPAVKLDPIYLAPNSDNQKRGLTTRNCNLVVRGTTIYFSLIRTLLGNITNNNSTYLYNKVFTDFIFKIAFVTTHL